MFSRRIGWHDLAVLCRKLSTMLQSGVDIAKAFEIAARQTRGRTQAAMLDVSTAIKAGSDVTSALQKQGEAFPPLVIHMVEAAESGGAVPEILVELADHYENQSKLRTAFLVSIAWPMFQLFAAILVITGVIVLLGWIADLQGGGEPLEIFGPGLVGTRGAIIFLSIVFGTFALFFFGYQAVTRLLGGQKFLDPFLLKLPVIGKCLQDFAIARYAWTFALTQQTGMPMNRSIEASLKATNNGAFMTATPTMNDKIGNGATLHQAMAVTGLFPQDFLEMVDVAETSGTVPEMFQRNSAIFQDKARRSLQALTAVLGWLVWVGVAVIILYFVFRVAFWYIGMIQDALDGTF